LGGGGCVGVGGGTEVHYWRTKGKKRQKELGKEKGRMMHVNRKELKNVLLRTMEENRKRKDQKKKGKKETSQPS